MATHSNLIRQFNIFIKNNIMHKRLFFTLCSLGFLQVFIVACCPDNETYYSIINGIFTNNYQFNEPVSDSSLVALEDYQLLLGIEDELITEVSPLQDLVTSSYALSCDDYIRGGLRSKVKGFQVSANKAIFGTAADTSLDPSKLSLTPDFNSDGSGTYYNVDTFIEHLNEENYFPYFWYLTFKDTTNSSEYFQFTLSLELENGTVYESTSPSVRFN